MSDVGLADVERFELLALARNWMMGGDIPSGFSTGQPSELRNSPKLIAATQLYQPVSLDSSILLIVSGRDGPGIPDDDQLAAFNNLMDWSRGLMADAVFQPENTLLFDAIDALLKAIAIFDKAECFVHLNDKFRELYEVQV